MSKERYVVDLRLAVELCRYAGSNLLNHIPRDDRYFNRNTLRKIFLEVHSDKQALSEFLAGLPSRPMWAYNILEPHLYEVVRNVPRAGEVKDTQSPLIEGTQVALIEHTQLKLPL